MNNETNLKDIITVYACGGAGINIASRIPENDRLNVIYVDTSDSNVRKLPESDTRPRYLFSNMDGSGKDQQLTYQNTASLIPAFIAKHPPLGKFAVVIAAFSGGTGSMLSLLITKELHNLEQHEDDKELGLSVFLIGVSTVTSDRHRKNSINTIQNYINYVDASQKPVPVFFSRDLPREEVYTRTTNLLKILTTITDPSKTEELDRSDIHNFVNFHRVTPIDPELTLMSYRDNGPRKNEPAFDNIIAASIIVGTEEDVSLKGEPTLYSGEVIVTDPEFEFTNIRIDNSVGDFPHILSELKDELRESEEQLKAVTLKKSKVSEGDKADGFITFGGR